MAALVPQMVQRPARDPIRTCAILADLHERQDPLRSAVNVDRVHGPIVVFRRSVFEEELALVVVPATCEHRTEGSVTGILFKAFEPDQVVAAVKTVIPRLVCRLAIGPTSVCTLRLGRELDGGFRQCAT